MLTAAPPPAANATEKTLDYWKIFKSALDGTYNAVVFGNKRWADVMRADVDISDSVALYDASHLKSKKYNEHLKRAKNICVIFDSVGTGDRLRKVFHDLDSALDERKIDAKIDVKVWVKHSGFDEESFKSEENVNDFSYYRQWDEINEIQSYIESSLKTLYDNQDLIGEGAPKTSGDNETELSTPSKHILDRGRKRLHERVEPRMGKVNDLNLWNHINSEHLEHLKNLSENMLDCLHTLFYEQKDYLVPHEVYSQVELKKLFSQDEPRIITEDLLIKLGDDLSLLVRVCSTVVLNDVTGNTYQKKFFYPNPRFAYVYRNYTADMHNEFNDKIKKLHSKYRLDQY